MYPPCDVALYHTAFGQPGEPGTTYLYSHAREGTFLPLLEQSERQSGRALLGSLVQVYTSDDRVHIYQSTRVKPHATDVSLVWDAAPRMRSTMRVPRRRSPAGGTIASDIPAGFEVIARPPTVDQGIALTLGEGTTPFTNRGTLRLTGDGSATLYAGGGPLVNEGTLAIGSPTTFYYYGGSLDNRGTLEIGADTSLGYSSYGGDVTNTGTIHVAEGVTLSVWLHDGTTAGRTFTQAGGTLDIDGSLDVSYGTFEYTGGTFPIAGSVIMSGGTFSHQGGTLDIAGSLAVPRLTLSGGTLAGTGTVTGAVVNSGGTVSPGSSPGTLTIDGPYTQESGGRLRLEITGTGVGAYDRLVVTGAASLDGILTLISTGYTPALDDLFPVLPAGSLSGAFATLEGAALGGGLQLTPDLTPTMFRLRVTARRPTVSLTGPTVTRTRDAAVTLTTTDPAGAGIAGYLLSEDGTTPAVDDVRWVATKPTTFQLSTGDATKTVHAWAKDAAGAISQRASAIVLLDTTAPTATLTAPAVTSTRAIAVTLGGTDTGGSGITAWAVVEGTTAPAANDPAWVATKPTTFQLTTGDGSKTVSAFSRDAAGNVSVAAGKSVVLDTVIPTVSLTAPASIPTRAITVTLGGTDAGSGITAWSLVEGTVAPVANDPAWVATKPTTFTLSRVNGDKTVSAFSRDAAGNVSLAASKVVTLAASLPTLTLTLPAAVDDRQVPVTLVPVDTAGVGITRYLVSEDATTPAPDDARWTDTLPTTVGVSAGEGSRTLSAWVRDANGNPSARVQATTLLDTTAPSVSLVIDGDAPTTPDRDVTLAISAADGSGSGVVQMRFSDDGTTFSALEPYATTKAWTMPAGADDHTVTVRVRDAAGNTATASDTISLATSTDTTPPTASPPVATLTGSGTLGTTARIHVTWPAATDDVGVTSYRLQRKTGTGAWTDVALPTSLALAIDIPVTPGTTTTTLRLRALDAATNASDWQAGPAFKVSVTQETATATRWTGAWTSASLSGASGGRVRWAKLSGRRATFTVTGTSVALVSAKGRDRGKAQIWVDGTRVATLDLYAASTKASMVVWASSLTAGPHTVQLRVLGTKRTAAISTRVDLDAWLVSR